MPVNAGPTIMSSSTIETSETTLTAGKLSQATFQSRDTYGTILDNTEDNYVMTFTGPSENGDSATFSLTAVYQSNGLYLAQFVPRVSGTYSVSVMLWSETIAAEPQHI